MAPAANRSTVTSTGSKLRLSIPLHRRHAVLMRGFLTLWVAVFAAIEIKIWTGDPARRNNDPVAASLGVLIFFVLCVPLLLFLWRVAVGGRDVVTIENDHLALRREPSRHIEVQCGGGGRLTHGPLANVRAPVGPTGAAQQLFQFARSSQIYVPAQA